MKRITRIAIAAVLLALLPTLLLAQGDLTLEGLAARLDALFGRVDSHEERLSALETRTAPTATLTPTPKPTSTPEPTATDQTEERSEAEYLAALLALNDYEGIGGAVRPMGSFFRLPDQEQTRLISLYHSYFIQAAQICELSHAKAFQLFNRLANLLESEGFRGGAAALREEVPTGGSRLDFIYRIATYETIQALIEEWTWESGDFEISGCEEYLVWYTKPVLGD